jgi:hypothetical protein
MFRRVVFFVLCACLVVGSAPGQQPPSAPQSTSTTQPLNAAALKKLVGFLRVSFLKDGQAYVAAGTCFFVLYEDKRLGDNGGFVYLVTNRHVAVPGIDDGQRYPVQWTKVRLNLRSITKAMESEEANIPLGAQMHWYFPSDDGVDLAVLPILPDQAKYDYQAFPVSLFATKDSVTTNSIAEGDNVLFTGYFYQFPGLKKVEPIVREGILAMMPDESLETTLHRPGQLYLADVHVFGGNSGSPLFVNVGGYRNGSMTVGGFPYRLLGVISGGYTEDTNFKLTIATTMKGTFAGNSGIATVVPIDELKALLDSPALRAGRDAELAAKQPKNQMQCIAALV